MRSQSEFTVRNIVNMTSSGRVCCNLVCIHLCFESYILAQNSSSVDHYESCMQDVRYLSMLWHVLNFRSL